MEILQILQKLPLWIGIPESSSLMEDLQMPNKVQFLEIQRSFETFQMTDNQNSSKKKKNLVFTNAKGTGHHIMFMNFPY